MTCDLRPAQIIVIASQYEQGVSRRTDESFGIWNCSKTVYSIGGFRCLLLKLSMSVWTNGKDTRENPKRVSSILLLVIVSVEGDEAIGLRDARGKLRLAHVPSLLAESPRSVSCKAF